VTNEQRHEICVLCSSAHATTREHVPAQQLFDRPLPGDLITVPSCVPCNSGSQRDDEFLRSFLLLLRDAVPAEVTDRVRSRMIERLHRPDFPGLLNVFRQLSEIRIENRPAGPPVPALFTRPDSGRLRNVLGKYARGLYYHVTHTAFPVDAILSMERVFNMETRPPEYWTEMLAAFNYARANGWVSVGTGSEFRYAFRIPDRGPVLAAMVLEFYRSFPYVVVVFAPGTDFERPQVMPY
jgi:hypothetical protein